MNRCAICNKHLTDPVSVARGIGPECAINSKRDMVGQQNLFGMRAKYTYEIIGDTLCMEDCLAMKSLTNDMENALEEIEEAEGGLPRRIIYKDSDGVWDGVIYTGGRVDFYGIGVRSKEEALAKAAQV